MTFLPGVEVLALDQHCKIIRVSVMRWCLGIRCSFALGLGGYSYKAVADSLQ